MDIEQLPMGPAQAKRKEMYLKYYADCRVDTQQIITNLVKLNTECYQPLIDADKDVDIDKLKVIYRNVTNALICVQTCMTEAEKLYESLTEDHNVRTGLNLGRQVNNPNIMHELLQSVRWAEQGLHRLSCEYNDCVEMVKPANSKEIKINA